MRVTTTNKGASDAKAVVVVLENVHEARLFKQVINGYRDNVGTEGYNFAVEIIRQLNEIIL